MAMKIDGATYVLVEFQHVKPGKGGAFVRTRLRRVDNGNVIEKTFRSGEKVDAVFLEKKELQFLYKNDIDQEAVLMDLESYDQLYVPLNILGQGAEFLKEESKIIGLAVDDQVITYELPNFVELRIVEAEPGIKGDTVSGSSTKGAVVETGAKVQVPYHINEGDTIKIDTRDGNYIERVNKK
ncbi:MAG: elongation factor P [Armatimonadetes bacterium]|nr:elongation factor P [Armatimonadota bacterium]